MADSVAMAELELVIGNKNYSSWSLRPWLFLRHNGVPVVSENSNALRRGNSLALLTLGRRSILKTEAPHRSAPRPPGTGRAARLGHGTARQGESTSGSDSAACSATSIGGRREIGDCLASESTGLNQADS